MMKDIVLDKLTVNYEKNAKIVYIKDDKERIRFVVSLIEIDHNEKTSEDNGWILKVQEVLFPKDELFELSRQFFKINEERKAYKTMEKMIRDYQTVVNLPCGKINPKDIFNDTVNYRKIDPDRCANCIFCIFHEDCSERV